MQVLVFRKLVIIDPCNNHVRCLHLLCFPPCNCCHCCSVFLGITDQLNTMENDTYRHNGLDTQHNLLKNQQDHTLWSGKATERKSQMKGQRISLTFHRMGNRCHELMTAPQSNNRIHRSLSLNTRIMTPLRHCGDKIWGFNL